MNPYQFRTSCIPGVIVGHNACAASYEIGFRTHMTTRWGGVVNLSVAKDLKPWAEPVPLTFDSFRVGTAAWIDLEDDQRLWGCLLRGPRNLAVLFALIENDWPVVRRSIYGPSQKIKGT